MVGMDGIRDDTEIKKIRKLLQFLIIRFKVKKSSV